MYLFKRVEKAIFLRDNYICQLCNKPSRELQAHHIKLFVKFIDLRYDLNNGITLCRKCHSSIRMKEEKFEKFFQDIVNKTKNKNETS